MKLVEWLTPAVGAGDERKVYKWPEMPVQFDNFGNESTPFQSTPSEPSRSVRSSRRHQAVAFQEGPDVRVAPHEGAKQLAGVRGVAPA